MICSSLNFDPFIFRSSGQAGLYHRMEGKLGATAHETVLRRGIRRFDPPVTGPARRPSPQAQGPSPADPAAENARLKRERQKAEMERDILK